MTTSHLPLLNILYFSTRYPEPLRESIQNNSRFSDAASAAVFSDAIFQGMTQNEIDFINVNNPPVGYWPRMNKRIWIPTSKCVEQGRIVWNVGSVNIYVYQYFSVFWHTYRTIKRALKGESATCLVYAINVPTIRAILRYRKIYAPRTKIVLVIPDLIEDMYAGNSLKSRALRWLHGDIDEIYEQMDGFVYLTEQMREKTKSDKPYCVVEGIFDPTTEEYKDPYFSDSEKIVFYSGKLQQKFGARNLVDAFCMIPDEDARLVLCGSGDSEEYIRKRAASDSRIRYMGQIPREEVLRLQSKARLLVNPRTPEGEFTRYSFPSKNIQYLASGIPTLLYRLEGIPEEYYQYCLSIESDKLTVEDLSRAIQNGIHLSNEECQRKGKAARQFVLENKNARIQSKKIIDLINQI